MLCASGTAVGKGQNMKRGKDVGKTNTTPDAAGSEKDKAVRAASAEVRRRRKRAAGAVITVLVAVLIFAAWLYGRLSGGIAEGEARFYFFDVGQGDAAAIVTRDACIVVDAGTEASEERLRLQLERAGIRRIDLAVFTHPHEDHIGGADMLIENFEVGAVLMPDNKSDTLTYSRLISALQSKNIELIPAEEGYTAELGGLSLCVLFASADATDENDMSAVVRISFGETSAIFTGDAGESAEKMILAKYPSGELTGGILKVGHHGSSTSTCAEWAEALSPQFAVISCGAANDYGQPHDEVLRRLAALGAEIFRTDLDGTVCFVSDGRALKPMKQ